MDEQPVQLVKETRLPLPRIRRVDYERAGTAFMFCEALSSWRRATPASAGRRWTGPRKSPACWKAATRTASALVCDNFDTCTPGAFCEASCAGAGTGQASRCAPKHEIWLNVAENELRIRQCLRHRRVGDTLQAEAWSVDVNERQRGVDWES